MDVTLPQPEWLSKVSWSHIQPFEVLLEKKLLGMRFKVHRTTLLASAALLFSFYSKCVLCVISFLPRMAFPPNPQFKFVLENP